ncbi:ABC transporter ATP-binding protein [Vibrio sp. 10N.286.49.B3]|uniref:ATP-binding cassette domain-containing protein n=1 Tax=Vibrio sp. 10N.286.49.B3 TaxID=1880855 RepID=UPI000C8358B5|nr:ATP-binding cassette domain-containing protein [Vibrio sp. 10N.286.49.B3]PMH46695.1 ABC transporter ATP-binding protein [Vibrio sp. 10N.286.49.B3]
MSFYLNNLTITKRDGMPLFSNLDIEVKPGSILTIMGPSGCGKSTLLNYIAGHLSSAFSYTGQLHLDHIDITTHSPHTRGIGILFQDDLLFPHMTIWQNLAFALPDEIKGKDRQYHAINALENIALQHLAGSFPDQISGGQRARVSLIRMLLAKPKLALLDEPFSKLDQKLRSKFRLWVFQQLQLANIPTIIVTHDSSDIPPHGQILTWPWESIHLPTPVES